MATQKVTLEQLKTKTTQTQPVTQTQTQKETKQINLCSCKAASFLDYQQLFLSVCRVS